MVFHSIKKPVSSKGNRLWLNRQTPSSAVSSAARLSRSLGTRGFVPPGYPGFTFSETSIILYYKEQSLCPPDLMIPVILAGVSDSGHKIMSFVT